LESVWAGGGGGCGGGEAGVVGYALETTLVKNGGYRYSKNCKEQQESAAETDGDDDNLEQ
jgi:hypothetical protein